MLTPEAFRKTPQEEDEQINKRMFHVDKLQINKEKKLFFDKVENVGDYFPFGRPGGGAPLKNERNEIISRLPKIWDNIWQRGEPLKKTKPDDNRAVFHKINVKKREINDYIDLYMSVNNEANQKHLISSQWRSMDSLKPDSKEPKYWNDWFGRPGAGAPNAYSFNPNTSSSYSPSFHDNKAKTRSNHQNNYQLPY
jgi:hypothetical protein